MRMKIVLLHSIIALAAGDNPRSGKDISVLPVSYPLFAVRAIMS
jgi:hypothetical protein